MSMRSETIPKKYHDAVVRWRETYLPDYDLLIQNWDRFFPKDPEFKLCAFRQMGMCSQVECGDRQGEPKATRPDELAEDQGMHLLGAIRAQASTEFGSIQQHQLTLSRAQEEQDQFWVMRMMAEELRHGYQMLHLLLEKDWSAVSDTSGGEMVEEILSMRTGSHVLGAFNVDFDSFVDNITFCCLIDRVGKYQLTMQRISAYKPMAESMPQMLREEAFHLATGVVPMRRWAEQAAGGSVYITMEDMQKAINKWLPRGLEMFGDERGGGTNVRYGLKPMKNAEAQQEYYDEVSKVIDDLNIRFIRARLPELGPKQAETVLRKVSEEGSTEEGIRPEDLLRIPHPNFFRRRGVPAFRWYGIDGAEYEDFELYVDHLTRTLPDAYRAGRDFKFFLDQARRVAAGELDPAEAGRLMPELRRVGGVCPCSNAVRWVTDDEPATKGRSNGSGAGKLASDG